MKKVLFIAMIVAGTFTFAACEKKAETTEGAATETTEGTEMEASEGTTMEADSLATDSVATDTASAQ